MDTKSYIILFLAICVITQAVYIILQYSKGKNHTKSKLTDEERNSEAELRNIDAKLNQHLFKNVLNSVQSHTYQAYYTIEKLSDVLDYVLYESSKSFVTPQEEIRFAEDFISINKIKLSPLFNLRVKTKIDTQDLYYNKKVLAPLLSIDFIENAFKHADLQTSDAFISITVELKNGCFILMVSNKICERTPILPNNSGFGTETLAKRLEILYKDRFVLQRRKEGGVFLAYLKIQLYD